jgi:eukaryotic-like serine/threonine-protein kinase
VLGQLISGRYEIERVVASGGMATVFRAFDTVLERAVALKVLDGDRGEDEESLQRFLHEARAAARLAHPNIVAVLDRGEQGGRQFIVFEHVDGETLKERVSREGALPIHDVAEIGAAVARALDCAHENGVVHRDVKPQNVLLTPDGVAKVTDFGIAQSTASAALTDPGTVLGTSSYIAPEQARGEQVGPATDVYSLGCVLYELLTAAPPYPGETFYAVAVRHVRDPVPDVRELRPDCPPELASLVARCLAKVPDERPSAAEAARELGALAEAPLAPPVMPADERTLVIRRSSGPTRRRPRRGPALALAGLVLVALAVVAAALLTGWREGGTGDGPPVRVVAAATFDPVGGDGEHDETLSGATDGDPSTYWTTEGYGDFRATKDGIGLIVDAGTSGGLSELTVTSDLPGWTAEIKAASSQTDLAGAPTVGESQRVGRSATWSLDSAAARYYLIWITAMERDSAGKERAHINEITARG